MKLNGWDEELRPKLKPSKIQHRTVEEITAALRDLAAAGAVLAPDDPAINEIRRLLGLSEVDLDALAEDAALTADLERRALEAQLGQPQEPEGEEETPEAEQEPNEAAEGGEETPEAEEDEDEEAPESP